jgi:4-hydroxythreonine-4-phosphate dehydrogenase
MSAPVFPVLALTQGDPAGIGPEILLRLLTTAATEQPWRPLLIAERAALEAQPASVIDPLRDRFEYLSSIPDRTTLEGLPISTIPVLDPVAETRQLAPGTSGGADAAGAVAALDAGVAIMKSGVADAMVTAPVSKASIAAHHDPDFRGHTDHLARASGLERYGRDYLMTFLTPDLQVALLTTHQPLVEALEAVSETTVLEALLLLDRLAGGRIAVAGLNPHAGEGGLLGSEDGELVRPAVVEATTRGVDASGPESADSLFSRARGGEFDWVLALYHDQGLIAVKTSAFGLATNWTLGLPFLRTSVDHGTAFELAGKGVADARPIAQVVETTLALLSGKLPRRA